MLTVQEIQDITFEKAVFGGYDMKTVDTFIEQVAQDYTSMQKENAALKSKMKVLVDKIEEYRSVEDGMRRALVSAQNIAQETIDKAKAESEQMLQEAKAEADCKISEYEAQIQSEAEKLELAKKSTLEFISQIAAFYDDQMKKLTKLSATDSLASAKEPISAKPVQVSVSEQSAAETANPPEEKQEKYQIPDDIRKFMENSTEKTMKFDIQEVELASSNSETQHDTRGFDFGELKFGADYNPTEDK